jgi:hypothetical protein
VINDVGVVRTASGRELEPETFLEHFKNRRVQRIPSRFCAVEFATARRL